MSAGRGGKISGFFLKLFDLTRKLVYHEFMKQNRGNTVSHRGGQA